jgi:lysylphosphatidylglycerol synthetase-like protein (DUF2156 family)
MQLIDTICMLVAEEMDAGGHQIAAWAFFAHLCLALAALLGPLVAVTTPPKVRGVKAPLKAKIAWTSSQFRSFYVASTFWHFVAQVVVVFLHFVISLQLTWLAVFLSELVSLAYHVWVGYRFRPTATLKQMTTQGPILLRFYLPAMFTQRDRRYAAVPRVEDTKEEDASTSKT